MNAFFLQSFIQSHVSLKPTSNGWKTCNAPCCIHNNETLDKRGRGGFLFEGDGTCAWHCFNCSYTTNWVPGRPLSLRFKNLLKWFGIPQDQIDVLQFDALELKANGEYALVERQTLPVPTSFPTIEMPVGTEKFSYIIEGDNLNEDFLDVMTYAYSRHINLEKYDLMWSPNKHNDWKLSRHVIVPFYYHNNLVGWSSRAIDKKQFIKNTPKGYVYNLDEQIKRKSNHVIVCEGLFDAMTIDAVAVLHGEINDDQANIIESLNKEIIVVPDFNETGMGLVNDAMKNGWGVSFPVWGEDYKDINEAVDNLGKLFVLETIFNSVVHNKIKIELLAKKFMKKRIKINE
jgi:hypothetical protein